MITSVWGIALKTLRVKMMRTLFSVLAITLAVGLLIAMVLLMRQINFSLEQQLLVKYGGANFQVEYRPNQEGYVKTIGPEVIEELFRSDYTQSIEPVLNLSLRHEDQQDYFLPSPVTYYGVNDGPFVQARFQFQQALQEGEVILTRLLAGRLEAEVGDTVVFPLESGHESPWRVAGIIDDLRSYDGTWQDQALFHLESVQKLVGLEGRATQLLGQLSSDDERLLARAISNKEWNLDEDLNVSSLYGLQDERLNVRSLQWTGNILAIVAFVISSVLLLGMLETSFREKLKDLAVIRSMGGSPEQIRRIALYESSIISVLGVAGGIGLGIFAVRYNTDLIARWLQVELYELPVHVSLVLFVGLFALAALIAMSQIPANRVARVDPIQSFREADYDETEYDGLLWPVLAFGALGVTLLFVANYFFGAMRALLGLISGLILLITAVGVMVVTLHKLFRYIAAMFSAFGGRIHLIAVEQLAADRKQTAYVITVIGLTLAVFVTISTYVTTVVTINTNYINARYATEIVVNSPTQHQKIMGLSEDILGEIRQIPDVSAAIPLTFETWTQLVDYDFSRADKKFLSDFSYRLGRARIAYEQIYYVRTDFQQLINHQFLTKRDIPPDSAVISKSYAHALGVEVGDVLRLEDGESFVEITIGAIVDRFLSYRNSRALFIDLDHPTFKPSAADDFQSILIVPASSDHDEILAGMTALQKTYPELRWSARQGEIEQFKQQANQRVGILWAVASFVFVGGMMGMFNALSASIHARRREYAILRAIYLTPVQMAVLVIYQSLIATMIAILLGLIGGAVLFFGIFIGLGGFNEITSITVAWKDIIVVITLLLGVSVIVSLPMSIKLMRLSITRVLSSE